MKHEELLKKLREIDALFNAMLDEALHEKLRALIARLEAEEVLAEGDGYFGADCLSGDTCIDYLSIEPFHASDIPVHVTVTKSPAIAREKGEK